MSTYSPTVFAYPETFAGQNGVKISGLTTYSTANDGVHLSLPTLVDSSTSDFVSNLIPCSGFDEMYLTLLTDTQGPTCSYYVHAFYGNKQNGGTSTMWERKLLASISTTSAATPVSFTSPFGKTWYSAGAVTLTLSYSAVLDSVIGCASLHQNGSSTIFATVGFPHLGGADYIGIASNSSTLTTSNVLVKFG